MLIKRCPNLERLSIDGHSPHAPVDAHGLLRGRWPNLRFLLIGDVVLDWHIGLNPALGKPFRTFLEAHRNLESLHLQSHAPSVASPSVLSDLQPDALAKLTTFSGALVQAQVLPARESLKVLRVPDAMILRDSTQLSVSASLGLLPALSSLTIAFRLEHGYDNGSALRTIVTTCPHLRHLDFTVACRPSFTIVNAPFSHSPPLNSHDSPGNIRAMHPSFSPTTHPRTTHRTLPRRSIPPHKRRPPSTRKPTPRILRARLPPAHALKHILPPSSHPAHVPLIPITTKLLPHARPSPLLPLDRRTRSPIGASCTRASRTSILAGRVCASLNNRYASCWCTGNSSPSASRACAGAIASGRGSPFVVVLCSPAVGCHLGVYQVVTGTRVASIYLEAMVFFPLVTDLKRFITTMLIVHLLRYCTSANLSM